MRRRSLLLGALGVAGVAALLWATRTQDLLERLIRDAATVYGQDTRRTHVDPPVDAAFGDLLTPALPEFRAAYDEYKKLDKATQDACTAVREGEVPFSSLPRECREDLERHRDSLATLLHATHAARMSIPVDLDSLHAEDWAPGARGWVPVQHAAKLAALDIRSRLAAEPLILGARRLSLDECLDGLALGRDVSHSRGLVGSMIATAIFGLLTQSCSAALDRASAEEKARAAEAILRIRDSIRSFDMVLIDESVFGQLAWANASLSSAQMNRLPADAVVLAHAHPTSLAAWQRMFPSMGWRCLANEHEKRLRAMALPRNQRAQAISDVHTEAAGSWNPMCRGASGDFGAFYTRYLRGLERLELLAAAASADRFFSKVRRWPTTEELRADQPGLDATPLSVIASDGGLRLELPDAGYGAVSVALSPDEG